jgi:Kdo2-lipid IVA lauroyltransferase/acyltransferase
LPNLILTPSFTNRLLFPLEAAGFAAIAGLTRALPVGQASTLSGAAWRKFAPLNRRHARADSQLAIAMPELNKAQRAKILDGMWDNLGRTTAESFHLDEILNDPTRIEIPPELADIVQKVKLKGGVFVSLHLGNWELAVPLLAQAGLDVTSVYQRIRNPHVDNVVTQMRAKYYRGGLLPKSADAAKQLLRVATRGGVIAIMGDLRDFRGEPVPFFGRPAPSNTFPAVLARQRKLPLYVAKIMRLSGARFKLCIEQINICETSDKLADIRDATCAIQAQFERWIRETPEQWMWGHRRWG